jgi:hypothetical protein
VLGGKVVAAVKPQEMELEEKVGLVDPHEELKTECAQEHHFFIFE